MQSLPLKLTDCLEQCPLIAILRGITPEESPAVAELLIESGFTIIEVPLNSPQPYDSIHTLSQAYRHRAIIGAGTVIEVKQVDAVHEAGGQLVFSPNCDTDVIRRTKQLGMISIPGCCTPSEAFRAIQAGADAIKLFPAEMISPAAVKAMRAVLPAVPVLAVGGIGPNNMQQYLHAGANGFGIGSSLYKAGKPLAQIQTSAKQIMAALRSE